MNIDLLSEVIVSRVGLSENNLPGGVPQHNLRSSICSTSNPINQAPSETSSFAYLCRTCLVKLN